LKRKPFRGQVFDRDAGVCAECRLDTRKLVRELQELWNKPGKAELLQKHGYCLWDWPRSLWQADHIVPIIEGGADTLENLRTLCLPCHLIETAKLSARRAKRRRALVQP
jgi:5-methylcytosine-specific restriction enzyme A